MSLNTTGTQNWVDFLSLCYDEGGFFVLDESTDDYTANDYGSGMLCYEVDVMPPKMHGATRQLVVFSAKFKTYTGT